MGQSLVPTLSAAEKTALQTRLAAVEKELTPEGASLLAWSRKWFSDGETLQLKRVWTLGDRLNRALGDKRKYGEGIVEKLAVCLSVDKGALYKAQQFNRDFDEAALKHLIECRFEGRGTPVTMAHVYVLMTVTDTAKRDAFLAKAVANDWTPTMLGEAVREHDNRPAHAGGRSVKIPESASGKLDNLDKVLAVFNRNHTVIYANDEHGILTSINDLPPDRITPDLVRKLDESLSGLQQAQENISQELELVNQARDIAIARLAAQSQEDAAGDADDIGTATS